MMSNEQSAVQGAEGTGDEDTVSMVDVLKEEAQLEEDADAVLGGSDANHCTYEQGYLSRQALYACASCVPENSEPAGVCLACSLECHEGHALYELYTKRNFCCDCGNEKFGENKCKLIPNKDATNRDNQYSQNFQGLYCTCHRPYPDAEDSVEDEMLQCSICEDWFHGRHLGSDLPDEDFEEVICDSCMAKCDFLYVYAALFPKQNEQNVDVEDKSTNSASNTVSDTSEQSTDSNVGIPATNEDLSGQKTSEAENGANQDNGVANDNRDESDKVEIEAKSADAIVDEGVASSSKEVIKTSDTSPECRLEELRKQRKKETGEKRSGTTFWPGGWREQLCVCEACKVMYDTHKVSFLPNVNDTIKAYEARGKQGQTPMYETGMQALQNMDRIQQVEVLTEYNSMKNELTDYLKKFAENKKTVREEDIKEFFQKLAANKRPRLEMQHFCK